MKKCKRVILQSAELWKNQLKNLNYLNRMNFLKNKIILITGGTGSFGNAAVEYLTSQCKPKKIIIFSRDENKQYEMQKKFKNKNLRFFL